jgi:hypothetical protein
MSKLKFSDGEEFELDAPLHTELREDGWYVIGNNMMIPVDNHDHGRQIIDSMSPNKKLEKYGSNKRTA